jgi:hypothetical protein
VTHGEDGLGFEVSHPFAKKKANGWGTGRSLALGFVVQKTHWW